MEIVKLFIFSLSVLFSSHASSISFFLSCFSSPSPCVFSKEKATGNIFATRSRTCDIYRADETDWKNRSITQRFSKSNEARRIREWPRIFPSSLFDSFIIAATIVQEKDLSLSLSSFAEHFISLEDVCSLVSRNATDGNNIQRTTERAVDQLLECSNECHPESFSIFTAYLVAVVRNQGERFSSSGAKQCLCLF